ncbi:MAG TPA: universal stress protein [Thermoanaerobaculaceae bacterium]|nr:universal stress protein [Thermoanaerobaculaceae bacterium]
MYKTILVPLDGSKRAEAILPHVEELAHRFGAEVLFLHVVEPIPVAVDDSGYGPALDLVAVEQQTKDGKSYLARLQRRFHGKGIAAKARVAFGPAVSTILDLAKRDCVDMITMASHGRSGLARVFYGSVAAGVLHGVECSLLLIRSKTNE